MNIILSITVFAVALFSGTISSARHIDITLAVGDRISIHSGDTAVIRCENGNSHDPVNNSNPKCHTFHSDSECQGLTVGTACENDNDEIGSCVSEGMFAGAPNCECI